MKLVVFDRNSGRCFDEKVQEQTIMRFLYHTRLGRFLTVVFFSRKWFTNIYAAFKKAAFSRRSIALFIKDYKVNIDEFKSVDYKSFNHFFTREFKPGSRLFEMDPSKIPAFAEARYSGWGSSLQVPHLNIKQEIHSLDRLIQRSIWSDLFKEGPVILARLAPQDYHRFHYLDDGIICDQYEIPGRYHTVNPIATAQIPTIFTLNKKMVTIQETHNFGLIGYVDIGAMTVGSIVLNDGIKSIVKRGQCRGYFQYGGSTIIVIGQAGRWQPDPDITQYTNQNIEVLIRLGKSIGRKKEIK